MLRRRWPVRWWLASLVAGVALPLAILLTIALAEPARHEQWEARESAARVAHAMSMRLMTLHQDSVSLMERMAAHPAIRDFDGKQCDSLFAIIDFFPQYLALVLYDEKGNAVCSATSAPDDAELSLAVQSWAGDALRRGTLLPRKPVSQSVQGHWVAVLALPVGGRFRGTLVLAALPELVGGETLPPNSVVMVLDQEGTVVARSKEPERWVGRNVRRSELATIGAQIRDGHVEILGIDGISRLYGFTTVPDLGWSIYVGIPPESVMAISELRWLLGLVLGSVAIVIVLLLAAIAMSRAIGRPIQALVRAAESGRAGGYEKVPPSGGPEEIVTLAHAFNEMIESRARAERDSQATQSELKALSERLLTVQEEERTHIAREIHDDLGQALTALKMDVLGILEQSPTISPALRQRVPETLDGLVKSVQRIASELRPSILDDLGLAAAIELEARAFEDRTGIECELSVGDELALDSARASAIYRIVQEALTNVARHSNATRVEVRLRARTTEVLLEIRDDGRGMSAQDIGSARSLGLIGIRERAAIVGGAVRFEGVPGRGTIVSVRIPLHDRAGTTH